MQLVEGGPEIPDNLISAHEEGRVVFFCGAGISVPARLPDFEKLAKNIIRNNKISLKPNYKNSIDRAFQSLEILLPNGRKNLLENLWSELQINSHDKPQKHYHDSLLTLSRSKSDGAIRLVTTNFDRIFEECLQKPEALVAPRLPVPKPNRWDGIAYLHGLIPKEKNDLNKNDNLVITSGDFGQAYLIERWAARFITELFRNYVVCFIGYSLNDPVMRYLTDALIKDEDQGIKFEERYIFLPKYEGKQKEKENIEWRDRGITAINYTIIKNNRPHTYLKRTLSKWASDHSKGSDAKTDIIDQYLEQKISGNITEKQILWALRDPIGAQYFSNMNPCFPIDFINILDSKQFNFSELYSFGHKWLPEKKTTKFSKLFFAVAKGEI